MGNPEDSVPLQKYRRGE